MPGTQAENRILHRTSYLVYERVFWAVRF